MKCKATFKGKRYNSLKELYIENAEEIINKYSDNTAENIDEDILDVNILSSLKDITNEYDKIKAITTIYDIDSEGYFSGNINKTELENAIKNLNIGVAYNNSINKYYLIKNGKLYNPYTDVLSEVISSNEVFKNNEAEVPLQKGDVLFRNDDKDTEININNLSYDEVDKSNLASVVEKSSEQHRDDINLIVNIITENIKNNKGISEEEYNNNVSYIKIKSDDNIEGFYLKNKKDYLGFGKNATIATIIHEKSHEYLESNLTDEDLKILEEWSGHKRNTKLFKEAFAKGAEKVIYDGLIETSNATVNNILERFKLWFEKYIVEAVNYFKDLNEMNSDVVNIYEKMFSTENYSGAGSVFMKYNNEFQNTILDYDDDIFSIPMIKVVGISKNGRLVVDVVFVESFNSKSYKHDNNKLEKYAKRAVSFAAKYNAMINSVKISSIDKVDESIAGVISNNNVTEISNDTITKAQIDNNLDLGIADEFNEVGIVKVNSFGEEKIINIERRLDLESEYNEKYYINKTLYYTYDMVIKSNGNKYIILSTNRRTAENIITIPYDEYTKASFQRYNTKNYKSDLFKSTAEHFSEDTTVTFSNISIISATFDGVIDDIGEVNKDIINKIYNKNYPYHKVINENLHNIKFKILSVLNNNIGKSVIKKVLAKNVTHYSYGEVLQDNNVVYNVISSKFLDLLSKEEIDYIATNLDAIYGGTLMSLINEKFQIKDINSKAYLDGIYYALSIIGLNIISVDGGVEIGYRDKGSNQMLESKYIEEYIDAVANNNKERALAIENMINFTTEKPDDESLTYDELNKELNINRLRTIAHLAINKKAIDVSINGINVGLLNGKFKSDNDYYDNGRDESLLEQNLLERLLNNIKISYDVEYVLNDIIFKEGEGHIILEFKNKDLDKSFFNIDIKLFAKIATASYINKIKSEFEKIKDKVENSDVATAYLIIEKTDAYQFILSNINILSESELFSKRYKEFFKKVLINDKTYIDISHKVALDKYKNILDFYRVLLKDVNIHNKLYTTFNKHKINDILLNKDAYGGDLLYNSEALALFEDYTTFKEMININMPQVLLSNAIIPVSKNKDKSNKTRLFYIDNGKSLAEASMMNATANAVNYILKEYLGSSYVKNLEFEFTDKHINNDKQALGMFMTAIKSLKNKSKITLYSNDGKFYRSVLMHEIVHYISKMLLSYKQRVAIENEVRNILLAEKKDVTLTDIYEYIADGFIEKFDITKMSLLDKFIAFIKGLINKMFPMIMNLEQFYYNIDVGNFKDMQTRSEYEEETDTISTLYKRVDDKYNTSNAIVNFKNVLFDNRFQELYVNKVIPYIYTTSSVYSTNVFNNEQNPNGFISNIKNYFNYSEDTIIKYKNTEVPVKEFITYDDYKNKYFELSIEDRDVVSSYLLYNNEDAMMTAIKLSFPDINIKALMHGDDVTNANSISQYDENNKNNAENLKTSMFENLFKILPHYSIVNRQVTNMDDVISVYGFSTIMNIVTDNIRRENNIVYIDYDSISNALKKLTTKFNDKYISDVIVSLYAYIGDYKGNIDEITSVEDGLNVGLAYFINNKDKIVEVISNIQRITLDEAEKIYNKRAKYISDILTKLTTLFTSQEFGIFESTEHSYGKISVNKNGGFISSYSIHLINEMITSTILDENGNLNADILSLFTDTYMVTKDSIMLGDEVVATINDNNDVNIGELINLASKLGLDFAHNIAIENLSREKLRALSNVIFYISSNIHLNNITNKYKQMLLNSISSVDYIDALDNIKRIEIDLDNLDEDVDDYVVRETELLEQYNFYNNIVIEYESTIDDLLYYYFYSEYGKDDEYIRKLGVKFSNLHISAEDKADIKLYHDIRNVNATRKLGIKYDSFRRKHSLMTPNLTSLHNVIEILVNSLSTFETMISKRMIKSPNETWTDNVIRYSPLNLFNINDTDINKLLKLKKRYSQINNINIAVSDNHNKDRTNIKTSPEIIAFNNNLLLNATIQFDNTAKQIGHRNNFGGVAVDDLSTIDFITILIEGMIEYGLNKSGIKKFPVLFDLFSDKGHTKISYIFTETKSDVIISVETKNNNITRLSVSDDFIYKAMQHIISWYYARYEQSMNKIKNVIGKDSLDDLTEDDVENILKSNLVLYRDYRIKYSYEKGHNDEDFAIKNYGNNKRKITILPGNTTINNHTIYNYDFVLKMYAYINNNDVKNVVRLFKEVISEDLENIKTLLTEYGYTINPKYNSLINNAILISEETTLKINDNIDDENKSKYINLFEKYLEKYKKEHSDVSSNLTLETIIAANKYMYYKNKFLTLYKEYSEEYETLKKEIAETTTTLKGVNNLIYYENEEALKNGQYKYHPILEALSIIFHIFNTEAQQLYKGDEFFYKDVSNFIKRNGSYISPIEVFDINKEKGIGETSNIIIVEDIAGMNSVLKIEDREMHTNGIVIQLPHYRRQLRISSGDNLGNISNGVLKTIHSGYNNITDHSYLMKMSEIAISREMYIYNEFYQNIVKRSYDYNVIINGEIINVYEKFLKILINNDAFQSNTLWQKAIDEFNDFLWEYTDEDYLVKTYIADKIVPLSAIKVGATMINKFTISNDTLEINENPLFTTVANYNYGQQIVKYRPKSAYLKSIGVQNIRMLGINPFNVDLYNDINDELHELYETIISNVDIYIKNEDVEGLKKYIDGIVKDIFNINNANLKFDTLLNSDNISKDITRSEIIKSLMQYINDITNFKVVGNIYVQVPAIGFKVSINKNGMPSIDNKGGRRKNLSPMEYYYFFEDKLVKINSKDELDKLIKSNTKIYVKPADVVMPFHYNNEFGIDDNVRLSEIFSYNDGENNFYESFQYYVNIVNDSSNYIKNYNSKIKNKLKHIQDDTLLGFYSTIKHLKSVRNAHMFYRLFKLYLEEYANIKNTEIPNEITKKDRSKYNDVDVLNSFLSKFHPNVINYISKKIKNNKATYINYIAYLSKYFIMLNENTFLFGDRIPHSGFNSAFVYRITDTISDVENSMFISSEKSILDGSDYDIDELHSMFNPIQKISSPKYVDEEEGVLTPEYITEKTIFTTRETIFDKIADVYLSDKNIMLNLMQIKLSDLIRYADSKDNIHNVNNKYKLKVNTLSSYLIKREQNYNGKDIVGVFVNITNAFSILAGKYNTLYNDYYVNAINEKANDDSVIILNKDDFNNIVFGENLKVIKSISEGNVNLLYEVLSIMQNYINGATDNSNLDGLIGKLGINIGNANIIGGILLKYEGEQSMQDYINSVFNNVLIATANIIYNKNNKNIKRSSNYEYKTALASAYMLLKSNLKDEELLKLNNDYKLIKDYLDIGEMLSKFYDIDNYNKLKIDEYNIYDKIKKLNNLANKKLENVLSSEENVIKTIHLNKPNSFINYDLFFRLDKQTRSYANMLLKYFKIAPSLLFKLENSIIRSKILEIQSFKAEELNEEKYNALSEAINDVFNGLFLETLGTITYNNKTYDFGTITGRIAFVNDISDIIKHIKAKYKTANNMFAYRLKHDIAYDRLPIATLLNINNIERHIEYELIKDFSILDKEDKDIIRIMGFISSGLKNYNTLLSFTDVELEVKYTDFINNILQDDILKNDNIIKRLSIIAIASKKELQKENDKINEADNITKPNLKGVYTTNKNSFNNNVIFIDADKTKSTIGNISKRGMLNITRKAVLNGLPIVRGIQKIALDNIYNINNGETINITKSKNILIFDRVKNIYSNVGQFGNKIMLENGVIATPFESEDNKNVIILRKEGLIDNGVINNGASVKTNIANNISNAKVSDFVYAIVSKIKSLFPNINIVLEHNDNSSITGYIKDGTIHLNVANLTADTPLHEVAHIVLALIKEVNVKLYNKLKAEIEGIIAGNKIIKEHLDKNFGHLDYDDYIDEAIALFIGYATSSRVEAYLKSIGVNNNAIVNIIKTVINTLKSVYNSFIKAAIRLFVNKTYVDKYVYNEDMTISNLADYILHSFMRGKAISNISSSELNDIIQATTKGIESIKTNVANTKISTYKEFVNLVHGDIIIGGSLSNLNEEQIINIILAKAKSHGGFVTFNNIDYNLGTDSSTYYQRIKDEIMPDINITKKNYIDNMIKWLNEKEGDVKIGENMLFKNNTVKTNIINKFLRAIRYSKNTRYMRYSDIEKIPALKDYYFKNLDTFDIIVGVDVIKGKYYLSFYNVSPIFSNNVDVINNNKKYVTNNIINKVKSYGYGFDIRNDILTLNKLNLQLILNNINYKAKKAKDNVFINDYNVILLNSRRLKIYNIDGENINKNIKKLADLKEFNEMMKEDFIEYFNIPITINKYNPLEQLNYLYDNIFDEATEAFMLKFKNNIEKYINAESVDYDLLNEIKQFMIRRMDYIINNYKYKEDINIIREMELIMKTYKYMFMPNVNINQINSSKTINQIITYLIPSINIGSEEFVFVQSILMNGKNKILNELLEAKEKLQGNKKKKGIIRILQDEHKKLNSKHNATKYIADVEHNVYKNLFATIKTKSGKDVLIGFLLWTTDESKDRLFAKQAKERLANNEITEEMLKQAEKIIDIVEEELVKRLKHYMFKTYGKIISLDDAKRLLMKTGYIRGMIPMMKKDAAERFYSSNSNIKDIFDINITGTIEAISDKYLNDMSIYDNTYLGNKNTNGLIESIEDPFIRFFDISNVESASGIETDYGSNLRLSNLGLSANIDGHGNIIEVDVYDNKLNSSFSTDLQMVLQNFLLSGVRKRVQETEVIPVVNFALLTMDELASNRDVKSADISQVAGVASKYADLMVHGINTIEDKNTTLIKVYALADKTFTPFVMFLNVNVAFISLFTNTFNSFVNTLAATLAKNDNMPQSKDLIKANMIFIKEFPRVVQWMHRYKVINSTEFEMISSRLRGVVGERYIMNRFVYSFLNQATDFHARGVAMVAYMLMHKSWDAHKFDKETGKEFYDITLDERLKDNLLRETITNSLRNTGGVNELGMITQGYAEEEALLFKAFSDRYIIGAYTNDTRNLGGLFFIGKLFGKFSTWMFSMGDAMFGEHKYLQHGGLYKVKKDENGEAICEFERTTFEGWLRTVFKLGKGVFLARDLNTWKKLDKMQKTNIYKGGIILSMMLITMLMFKYMLSDEYKKRVKKKEGYIPLIVNALYKSVMSLAFIGELTSKLERPFALVGLIQRTFSNTYDAFVDSDGNFDFDGEKLKKTFIFLENIDNVEETIEDIDELLND